MLIITYFEKSHNYVYQFPVCNKRDYIEHYLCRIKEINDGIFYKKNIFSFGLKIYHVDLWANEHGIPYCSNPEYTPNLALINNNNMEQKKSKTQIYNFIELDILINLLEEIDLIDIFRQKKYPDICYLAFKIKHLHLFSFSELLYAVQMEIKLQVYKNNLFEVINEERKDYMKNLYYLNVNKIKKINKLLYKKNREINENIQHYPRNSKVFLPLDSIRICFQILQKKINNVLYMTYRNDKHGLSSKYVYSEEDFINVAQSPLSNLNCKELLAGIKYGKYFQCAVLFENSIFAIIFNNIVNIIPAEVNLNSQIAQIKERLDYDITSIIFEIDFFMRNKISFPNRSRTKRKDLIFILNESLHISAPLNTVQYTKIYSEMAIKTLTEEMGDKSILFLNFFPEIQQINITSHVISIYK